MSKERNEPIRKTVSKITTSVSPTHNTAASTQLNRFGATFSTMERIEKELTEEKWASEVQVKHKNKR